jgi:hypothetical protein
MGATPSWRMVLRCDAPDLADLVRPTRELIIAERRSELALRLGRHPAMGE